MSRPDTWMPLYVGDYLADTNRLTTEMHGAYLLLIMEYWRAGEPLPDCDLQLASITRLSVERWGAIRPIVARFFQVAEGVWSHKRIEEELRVATERYAKTKARSDAANAAKTAKATGKVTSKVTSEEPQPQPHSPNGEKRDEPDGSSASAASAASADVPPEKSGLPVPVSPPPPPPPPIDPNAEPMDLDRVLWGEARVFLAHRMGKDPDSKAVRSLLGKWAKLYGNDVTLQAIRALQRQWKSHGEVHDAVAWVEKWIATNVRRTHGAPNSAHHNFAAGVGRVLADIRDAGDDRRERRRDVDAKVRAILGPAEPAGPRAGLPSPQ